MKPLAILLALLFVASAGFTAYLYLTCEVSVISIEVSSVEASAQSDTFEQIQNAFRLHAVTGTPFSDTVGDLSDCKFVTYRLHLRNTCFLPASTVEVSITPMQGDILQLPDNVQHLLPSRSEGVLECTLLTGIYQHTVREFHVTYYMWGIPFTLRAMSGGQ